MPSLMAETHHFSSIVTPDITAIPEQDWHAVFPSIAESYGFFKTLDETLTGQFKPWYIMLYENSIPVCLAPCFIMEYPLDTTLEGKPKELLCWIQKKLNKNFTLKMLLCGCQAAEGRLGLSDMRRADIASALLHEMEALARKEKASLVAFKDFPDDYGPFFQTLSKRGLHKMESYPSVELHLPFTSFEEYFATLSKATRKDLRRKFQKVDALPKVSFDVAHSLKGALLDEAYPLYLNTLDKSDVQFERLSKEFFQCISDNLPKETVYFLWKLDGKLVAFDLCLIHNGILVDEYIGMDYSVALQYHLYYVTFRDMVRWCIANNVRVYESGALNYDPKRRLDFQFVPENIYLKHLNPFINPLFAPVCLLLKPDNFDPILKEIKHGKPAKKSSSGLTLKLLFLILMTDILESVGEIFFKQGVTATGFSNVTLHNALAFLVKLSATPALWFGVLTYILNFVLWMAVLSRVDLSIAFPIGNATYIIIPFLSMLILHEKVSLLRWAGIACIIIGAALITRSAHSKDVAS
ncbi:MAG: GNAT family N-acetyltransferase [Candidatus Omnitrophica bacterium]|nr:GNAT family N-acetyltransferase [Candidatus Omnitrophota bacterium]